MGVLYQSSVRGWAAPPSSSQRSFERSKVAGSWGSGTSSGAQPNEANSRRRPSLTARARSGSWWSLKYWKGLDAAPSSPAKSIGVKVAGSSSAAAMWQGSEERGGGEGRVGQGHT